MTKLTPPAAVPVPTYDDVFAKAVEGAAALAKLTPDVCEELGLQPPELVLALLLYGGQISRTFGGKKKDFEAAAGQAFTDSADIFTVGQERQQAKIDDAVQEPPVVQGDVVQVLYAATQLIDRGWCQGDQAMKWIKAKTEPGGKKLINCLVKDPYASRWSLIGAIDAAAPNEATRVLARDIVFQTVAQSGFKFIPGSLVPTVLVDYNDYGWAPPLPSFIEPPPPESTDPKVVAAHQKKVEKLRKIYDTVTVPQWPKPKPDARTKDDVIGILDAAIRYAKEPVRGEEMLDAEPVDPGEGMES